MTPLELAAMVDRLNPDDDEARYLVPDLMAENQRIRHELQALRDTHTSASTAHKAAHNWTASVVWQKSADHITRILEGEHHE